MISLRGLFVKDAIIRYLTQLPILKTPVMDAIFTYRPQVELPIIGADMVREVARTMPVVKRGSPSIPSGAVTGQVDFYEPLPLKPSKFVTGADVNNLKVLGEASREAWATRMTDMLRRTCRMTTEAMCASALSGTLQWPVQLEGGGWETWTIAYGNILNVAVAAADRWNAAGAKLVNVWNTLTAMQEALQEQGYGGTVEIWAGPSAYTQLFILAEASVTTAKIRVDITDQGINVGGFLVKRRAERNRNPQTGQMAPVIPANDVRMVALDAGHTLAYCALDDLEANLQPLPFFINPIEVKDPSGVKLVAQSKPFPIPNPSGICTARVV